jgi:hypothetical protein
MTKTWQKLGVWCSACLLAGTVLSGCSSWGNKQPPRYNTVTGAKRVPALNPGGVGYVTPPLAANPTPAAMPPAPTVAAMAPSPTQLIDDETRRMLNGGAPTPAPATMGAIVPTDGPAIVSAAAPVEPVSMAPATPVPFAVAASDYPALSNVPATPESLAEKQKTAPVSMEELMQEQLAAERMKQDVANQIAAERAAEAENLAPSAPANVMAGEALPAEEMPWTAGSINQPAAPAAELPVMPENIPLDTTVPQYTPEPTFMPDDTSSMQQPTIPTHPAIAERMGLPEENSETMEEVVWEDVPMESMAPPPPIAEPTPQSPATATWQPQTPEVPAYEPPQQQPPAYVMNESGIAQPVTIGEYPTVAAIPTAAPARAPIQLVSPQEYGFRGDSFLPESRYSSRLKRLRRPRIVTDEQ